MLRKLLIFLLISGSSCGCPNPPYQQTFAHSFRDDEASTFSAPPAMSHHLRPSSTSPGFPQSPDPSFIGHDREHNGHELEYFSYPGLRIRGHAHAESQVSLLRQDDGNGTRSHRKEQGGLQRLIENARRVRREGSVCSQTRDSAA